ncbi:MAG: ATP-binding protein [Thermoguttaceae bacterium]
MSHQQPSKHESLVQRIKGYRRTLQLIAYEIHDGFTQHAVAALFHLEAVQEHAVDGDERTSNACRAAVGCLKRSILESRRLTDELRHGSPEMFGLGTAIGTLIAEIHSNNGPEVDVCWRVDTDTLSARVAHAVYRIIQEGLTNARRHSHSERVQVRLTEEGEWLVLEVEDFGVGFETDGITQDCVGLEGIRLRAALLGGVADIQSTPGCGTTISVRLPLTRKLQWTP